MASNNSTTPGSPHIQFLSFEDCPLADATQVVLQRALRICDLPEDSYESINILDPATSEKLASWGSPTILVNGKDVSGHARGDGVGCRIYATPDQLPALDTITAAIQEHFAS